MELPHLRIFVSSPGDVAEERVLAARVIRRLQAEFAARGSIEAILWEHEPLLATEPFQTQIARPSETEIVVIILWARLGTRLPANTRRSDGSPYASGTEYEFEDAAESWRRSGCPDLLVYRKMAEPVVSLSDKQALLERLNQKESLDRFIAAWFQSGADGAFTAAFHPFNNSAEYESLLEEHLRKLIQRRLPALERRAGRGAVTWGEGSPYRGLEVFDFEHAPIFFGRTGAVGDVLKALRAQAARGTPFVVVVGASGSGKSSLVRAGVVPLLIQPGVIAGVRVWRRAIFSPRDAPKDLLKGLAAALLRSDGSTEPARSVTVDDLTHLLTNAPETASIAVRQLLADAADPGTGSAGVPNEGDARILLVVDQAEELFTLDWIAEEQRQQFAEALASLVRTQMVWVIMTLRIDFYPRLVTLREVVSLKEGSGQYDLLPPSPTEIGQIVREPAFAAGLAFEQDPETKLGLDDLLRDEAVSRPGSLPILEFALEQLYQQRSSDDVLTYEAYRNMGGVGGALAKRAEDTFTALGTDAQATLPHVFRGLVRIQTGETEALVRSVAPLSALTGTPQAKAFIEAFVAARLFSTGLSQDGSPTITITHEALFARWPRLAAWLEQDRDLLRIRSRVVAAAALWNAEGRRADLLLAEGKQLAEAEMLERARIDLSDTDRALIRASIAKTRKRRLIKRLAIAALVLLTLTASLAGWISTRLLAESMAAQGEAFGLANRWDEAMDRYRKARTILQWIASPTTLVDIGLLEASDESPQPLNAFIADDTQHFGYRGYIFALAFSPDGRHVLSGGADNDVKLWDVRTGRLIRAMRAGGQIDKVAISRDGLLAVAGAGKLVKLWDLLNGRPIRTLAAHRDTISGVALSPNGLLLLSAASRELKLWDVQRGAELHTLAGHSDTIRDVAFLSDDVAVSVSWDKTMRFWDARTGSPIRSQDLASETYTVAASPDGTRLLYAGRDTVLRLWDVPSARETKKFSGHSQEVASVAFSPDGRLGLSGSNDSTARLWDLETGSQIRSFAHGDDVRAVAFSPDGRYTVSGGKGGAIKVWDARASDVTTLSGHSAGVTAVAFSPDGRTAISGSADSTLRLWDLETGQPLLTRRVRSPIHAVAFAPGGRVVAYVGTDGVVTLWDVESNRDLRSLQGRAARIEPTTGETLDIASSLVFYSDDLLLGGEVRTVFTSLEYFDPWKAWDLTTGHEVDPRKRISMKDLAFKGEPRSPAHSADDSLIVSRELDGALTLYSGSLWERALESVIWGERRPIRSLRGHSGPVLSVAFSPTGRTMLSGGADGTVKVWDLDRMARYRDFERRLDAARRRLQENSVDPSALKAFGEWYALRREWDWAADMLEKARAGGAPAVSSLALARAYWQMGKLGEARREFQRALDSREAGPEYIRLCLRALNASGAVARHNN